MVDPRKLGLAIVFMGIAGSLYFSEVMKFPPCALCWYQRIFLYPLAIVYAVALWTDDLAYRRYALPLVSLGWLTAIYHNLLYYGVISAAISPCSADGSCTAKQLELFGFLTIPLLSFAAFTVLAASELLSKPLGKNG